MKYLLLVFILLVNVDCRNVRCFACQDGSMVDCMDSLLMINCDLEKQSCVKIIQKDGSVSKGCLLLNTIPYYTDRTSCYEDSTQTVCPCNGDLCNSAVKMNNAGFFFIILPILVSLL
ncbi:hypothetical protein M3Y97_00957500 [Aphelenchoides bicaudatus]|nr:hypothetical protein M3Y97_00957500 [Aphelenchoides bicaudatus]